MATPLKPQPCIFVVFGATGDLMRRKLMPALYNLAHDGFLPEPFVTVGVGRRPKGDEEFRGEMRQAVASFSRSGLPDEQIWKRLASMLFYYQCAFSQVDGQLQLKEKLDRLDEKYGTGGRRLYYLAIPPQLFEPTIRALRESGQGDLRAEVAPDWKRIVVEKPFGSDLPSAQRLNEELARTFRERHVFRIDHYLGKFTVQNVLVFRFANTLWEPVWNRNHIDHVQITVAEDIGVEDRGESYEQAGALRDMVQNHLLQLLSLLAMEPPSALDAEAIRDEKVKVLKAVQVIPPNATTPAVVRGQYVAGYIRGQRVRGYREEPEVAADSTVETFVALKLFVENWRWAGVPFYLRTGKRMARRVTQLVIEFQRPPSILFSKQVPQGLRSNALILEIQPREGISLEFHAKAPGTLTRIRTVEMDFSFGEEFGSYSPEAYERLLLDAMLGDATLFTRRDEVEAAWAIIDPIRAAFEQLPPPEPYRAGTWGPAEADRLIASDGRFWRNVERDE
jgi:glucose-6-phosphate 1-dehydrogenase